MRPRIVDVAPFRERSRGKLISPAVRSEITPSPRFSGLKFSVKQTLEGNNAIRQSVFFNSLLLFADHVIESLHTDQIFKRRIEISKKLMFHISL